MKKLPHEKTIVTEIKVTLADLLTRSISLKSSVAAPVPLSSQFRSGDATITHGSPLDIPQVDACLIISSMEDFDVFPGASDFKMSCRGLFVHNGASGRVVVKPPMNIERVRINYIWA